MSVKKLSVMLGVLIIASMVLTACPAPQPQTIEKVVTSVVTEQVKVVETQVVEKPVEKVVTQQVEKVVEKGTEDYTTPHPILSDVKVRQAIAYCTNRKELIASVYPFVSDEEKDKLLMDTFLPKTHWAYKGPYQDYAFDPEKGKALLEEAGWKASEGAQFRSNDKGELLLLKFTTTNAQFRQTWSAVFVQNMAACGISIIPQYVPSTWWFGDTTGLARRDFELGAYAWVGESDPKGRTLYACDQIPLPSNNWEGQNSMGWCNETASKAIIRANNTLDRNDRIAAYDTVQKEFAKDMVSLPVFQRLEGEAWNPKLEGIKTSPTEYAIVSAKDWKMSDGADTVVIGFSQEPASMFDLVESSASTRQAYYLGVSNVETQFDYDYQPGIHDPLSTIESGESKNVDVEVKAGDMVYDSKGEAVKLDKGIKVFDVTGAEVEFDGSTPIKMKQLTSHYQFKPFTWSDGTKGSVDDLMLGYKIDCDKDSGSTSFEVCNQVQEIKPGTNVDYTITWLPGSQYSLYFGSQFHIYPSFQKISDGRLLKDVPAKEWATLPEIAEKPLSMAPFVLQDWKKGASMTFVRNEYYEPKPALSKVIIQFFPDSQTAVAALLGGDVDYLEKSTLGAGDEIRTVLDAQKEGKLKVDLIASPTWEHIDFNLFTK